MLSLLNIAKDADFLLGTDENSYPMEDKVRNANLRMDELVSIIIRSDGRWKWDDNNQSDLPIGVTDLEAGQTDYEVNGLEFLTIQQVRVKDSNGRWQVLDPTDFSEDSQGLADSVANEGLPTKYVKSGNSLILNRKPGGSAVTLGGGLMVIYQRPPVYFTTGDLAMFPGVNPLCHRYVSVGIAIDYAEANTMASKITTLNARLNTEAQKAQALYAKRSRDEQPKMTVQREDYGQSALLY